jgi:hypothetical protein
METDTIYNSLQILLYHYLEKEKKEREKVKITPQRNSQSVLPLLSYFLE